MQLRKPDPLLPVSAAARTISTRGTEGSTEDDLAGPHVPIRPGWPARRMSRAGYLAVTVVITGAVLVALVHRPSTAERAADLRAFDSDMQADIGSCAADVGASLSALRAVERGASTDVVTAHAIATSGAADCSPANDELLDDLIQYQVTESLVSFRLNRAVTGLVTWAADAQRAQLDVAGVLDAGSGQARQAAQAALGSALRVLDSQRTSVDTIIRSAGTALSTQVASPLPPG